MLFGVVSGSFYIFLSGICKSGILFLYSSHYRGSYRSVSKVILTGVLTVFWCAVFGGKRVGSGSHRNINISAGKHVKVCIAKREHLEVVKAII